MAYMLYYQEDQKTPRRVASLVTALYFVLLVLIVVLVKFQVTVPDEFAGGMIIDFGNSETGQGTQDLSKAEQAHNTAAAQDPKLPEDLLTQDFEEAPVIAPKKVTKPKQEQQKPVEKPKPVVNKKALFPGQSASNATSEGEAGGTGNQGRLDGIVGGARTEGNGGSGGGSFSLSGRKIIGQLPPPDYTANEQGRVVIEVKVNQQGRVTDATFRANGSTTSNHSLVKAAEQAAQKAVFNVDENAPFTQVGTITYNFRMQ